MGILKSPMPVCPLDKQCLRWPQVYLKDCVCSVWDEISFSLGLISVLSWGIAEVPQIITNYKEKTTEGMSLAFLTTWVIGDLFNLLGCWLEPATLPTQFYTAVLYTVTTMALFSQALYYGYMYKRVEAKITSFRLWLGTKKDGFCLKEEPKEDSSKDCKIEPPTQILNDSYKLSGRNGSKPNVPEESTGLAVGTTASTSPIPVASSQIAGRRSAGRDLYYTSARSLAKSHTPTAGSFISQIRGSWPRTSIGLSVDEESPNEKDLLTHLVAANSSAPTSPKSLFCVVGATFFLGSLNLHLSMFKKAAIVSNDMKKGFILPLGRKLLQCLTFLGRLKDHFYLTKQDVPLPSIWQILTMPDNTSDEVNGFNHILRQGEVSSMIGTSMGWMMAAIYMGGRLPQIYLNIKRGTAEGLNPLMFMFAIIGNATYVGSIIVRSTEWAQIKPNMPWLVDAGVCVLLDCFIIAQFIYFHYRKPTDREDGEGPYEAFD